jgi:peptidoglycan/LPS O-acetylase OafA/YrhL
LTCNTSTLASSNPDGPARTKRLGVIDSLRGAAALLVVVYHARNNLWIGIGNLYREYGFDAPPTVWLGYATYPISFGWLGVTLFFVLSGYCIHRRGAQLLKSDSNATLDLGKFFVRRAWRIYPTYMLALLLSAIIDFYVSSSNGPSAITTRETLSTASLLASSFALQGYLAPFSGTNVVYWTLAMEIHIYLAYPLLFYISKHRGPKLAIFVVAMTSIGFILLDALIGIQEQFPYRFSRGPVFLPYWFSWAVGFYLAEVEAKRTQLPSAYVCRLLWIVGLCAGLVLAMAGHEEHSEIFWALVAGSLLWSAVNVRVGHRWYSKCFGLMELIGVFSYSLYAVHYPAIRLFEYWFISYGPKPVSLLPLMAGVLFAIAFAYVFFLLVEQWTLKPPKTGTCASRATVPEEIVQ